MLGLRSLIKRLRLINRRGKIWFSILLQIPSQSSASPRLVYWCQAWLYDNLFYDSFLSRQNYRDILRCGNHHVRFCSPRLRRPHVSKIFESVASLILHGTFLNNIITNWFIVWLECSIEWRICLHCLALIVLKGQVGVNFFSFVTTQGLFSWMNSWLCLS